MSTPHETLDFVDFAAAVVKSLAQHKIDDGKIDSTEIITTLISTTPKGLKALAGAGSIGQEIDDLDDEGRKILIEKAMPVLMELVGIFFKLDQE